MKSKVAEEFVCLANGPVSAQRKGVTNHSAGRGREEYRAPGRGSTIHRLIPGIFNLRSASTPTTTCKNGVDSGKKRNRQGLEAQAWPL